jgi:hypothetical protein
MPNDPQIRSCEPGQRLYRSGNAVACGRSTGVPLSFATEGHNELSDAKKHDGTREPNVNFGKSLEGVCVTSGGFACLADRAIEGLDALVKMDQNVWRILAAVPAEETASCCKKVSPQLIFGRLLRFAHV